MPKKGFLVSEKNEEFFLMDRRRKVADLYLKGKTQWEIAILLSVSSGSVSEDLSYLRESWLKSSIRSFDEKKAEELAKIDRLEAAAWDGWERSCRDSETKTSKMETGLDPDRKRPWQEKKRKGKEEEPPKPIGQPVRLVTLKKVEEKTQKTCAGNPLFLERVAWCIDTRVRIMGLYKEQTNVNQLFLNWDELVQRSAGPSKAKMIEAQVRDVPRLETGITLELPPVEKPVELELPPTEEQYLAVAVNPVEEPRLASTPEEAVELVDEILSQGHTNHCRAKS